MGSANALTFIGGQFYAAFPRLTTPHVIFMQVLFEKNLLG